MNTNIGCLRRQNFTWEVAGTSVEENPRWLRFHRIFVYTCKQSNIMCSCCVWPHGNGLVGFYSLQKLFKLFFLFPIANFECTGAKGRYIPTYIGRHIRIVYFFWRNKHTSARVFTSPDILHTGKKVRLHKDSTSVYFIWWMKFPSVLYPPT